MAAPSVRASTSGTISTGSTIVVSMPTHQADDLILVAVNSQRAYSSVNNGFADSGSITAWSGNTATLVWKKATSASETVTITLALSGAASYVAYAISGIDWTACPLGGVDFDYQKGGGGTSFQQSNISSVYDNALLINLLMGESGGIYSATPTLNSWTQDADLDASRYLLWAGHRTITSAGEVTAPSITTSGSLTSDLKLTLHFIGAGERPVRQKVAAFDNVSSTSLQQLVYRNVNYDWVFIGSEGVTMETAPTNGFTQPNGLSWRYLGVISAAVALACAKLDDTATTGVIVSGTTSDYGSIGFVVRGANPVRPFSKIQWTEGFGATSHIAPSVKTADENQLHLALFQFASDETLTTSPTGYTKEIELHDSTNGSSAWLYSKEYSTAGSETSATLVTSIGSCFKTSLTVSKPASVLPAQVRAVVNFGAASLAGTTNRYQLYADAGEMLVLLDAVTATVTGESNSTISTPAALTHVPVVSEYDLANGWSLHAKACRLDSEITDGKVSVGLAADVGDDHHRFVAIVSGGHPDVTAGADVVDNTANAKTTLAGSVQLSDGAVLALAQFKTNPSVDPVATNAKRIFADAAADIFLYIDNSPDPSGGMASETLSFSSTTVKNYMMLLGFNTLGGGAGLFMGQDF